MKRNLFANYSQLIALSDFTSATESLISSADFVKIRGVARLDHTLTIREAVTGTIYTLEYGEESPLLDGSQGIYCTKDIKEALVELTITEYTFLNYSEEGEGQRKTSKVNKVRESLWLNRGLASDYDGQELLITDVGAHGSIWHSRSGQWRRDSEIELAQQAKGWIVPSLAAGDAATYSQSGTLITVTSVGHNIPAINYDTKSVYLEMGAASTGATIPPGWFTNFQRTGVDTFTCESIISQTGTGTVKTNIIPLVENAIVIPELNFSIKGGVLAPNGVVRYTLLGSNNNSAGVKNINLVFGAYIINHDTTTGILTHITDNSISNRNRLDNQVLDYKGAVYVLSQDTANDVDGFFSLHVESPNDYVALHSASIYAYPS